MVKMSRFFLIFLFSATLFASNLNQTLSSFDDSFLASNYDDRVLIYLDLKDKFKEAKNRQERAEFLKRLIFSSKILKKEYKNYEKELNSLGGGYEKYRKFINSKTKKRDKNLQSDLLLKFKPTTQPPNLVKKTKKAKNLVAIRDNLDNILLLFDGKVATNEIKTLTLNSKNSSRFVIDLPIFKATSTNNIKKAPLKDVRVANFKPGVTRVVLENPTPFKAWIKNGKDRLEIYSTLFSKTTPPKIITPKTTAPKVAIPKAITPTPMAKTIVIDPGHGGKDPGGMAFKLKEKDIVLTIGLKLSKELTKRGYKVLMTRSSDKFINLRDRTKFANKNRADMFISLHTNAAPNSKKAKSLQGFETFFLSPARSERSKNAAALENQSTVDEMSYFSKQTFLNFLNREKIISSNKLAIDIQRYTLNHMLKRYKINDGGVREAPFWVLVGALMPAVLVELGYITHPNESRLLNNQNYQNDLVIGIANGIDAYFIKNR